MEVAKEIYGFVGLSFPLSVKLWIENNTQSSSKGGTYSTKRDSISTMQAWRKYLTFDQVEDVQADCIEALAYFGYRTFNDANELLNFNISVML